MIDRLIDEINVCLNSNCYIAALNTALTLPDICDKAEYGKIYNEKTCPNGGYNRERYIKWCDKFVSNDTYNNQNRKHQYLDGSLILSLRNNALHEASYDIKEGKHKIKYFDLLVQDINRATMMSGSSMKIVKIRKKEIISENYLCINVVDLCLKICLVARKYFIENNEQFDFIKKKIVTVDKNTRSVFLLNDNIDYCDLFKLDKDKIKTNWDVLYTK